MRQSTVGIALTRTRAPMTMTTPWLSVCEFASSTRLTTDDTRASRPTASVRLRRRCYWTVSYYTKQAVGGQWPRCVPTPLPPWAPKRLPPPSRRLLSSCFPRPTRLTPTAAAAWRASQQSGLVTLTLTLKVVSESCVTLATPVPILVFLGLSVLDLGPMYATDRQTSDVTDRQTSDKSIECPRLLGAGA